ncbi:hypothetical protein EXIGLDRAFT_725691 [Exidia glandulosa HHB12029]|uniref:Uncharacterized protein n=1 Tax=Exidia glandulosa HHB12029 TaxID=1314781 RepID=A0A165Q8E7_EXIGL|nr:hypothetical protein EXIGLDRAFT_725691 [Exidia glandulosa HHB12029]
MSLPPEAFNAGSLYIAAFAQARSPHMGLLIPDDSSTGTLVHIRVDIDRATSPNWQYQCRRQRIAGEMALTSLLKIRDVGAPAGAVTVDQLRAAAESVPAPENDEFGECGPWVWRVVAILNEQGLLDIDDISALTEEFTTFAAGNTPYARRDRFPNVAVSKFCS